MDLLFAGQYWFDARLENRTKDVLLLKTVEFSLLPPEDAPFALPQGVRMPIAGTIEPGQEFVAPLELVDVTLGWVLSAAPLDALSVEVEVRLSVEAEHPSGRAFRTEVFVMPLTFCWGCLIKHDPEVLFVDEDGELSCDLRKFPAGHNPPSIREVCRPGQDEPVDCRLCQRLFVDLDTGAEVCAP